MNIIGYVSDLKIAKINGNKIVVVDSQGGLEVRTIFTVHQGARVFYKDGKRYDMAKALYLQ